MTAPATDQMARFDLSGDAFAAVLATNRAPIIAAARKRPSFDLLRAPQSFFNYSVIHFGVIGIKV